jgi:hypothetical protein
MENFWSLLKRTIKGVVGRRLTYKALTGALEPETC